MPPNPHQSNPERFEAVTSERPPAPLLKAIGIGKVYPDPSHKLRLLWHALMRPNRPYLAGRRVLHEIDLEIMPGETLGLIGRNGAGKSTLLSILSGLVFPTFGRIETDASIAVLLGSGITFNNDLTGRANALAYCRLNGMSQAALMDRVGEIEAFAELGEYFDEPVSTYSSGMQARLSFACAIAKHADILIIDEVLAVGDAEFKSKCYDYMKARQQAGQTYILVSHSPTVIANFCTQVCLLEKGRALFVGDPREALERYKLLQVDSGKQSHKGSIAKPAAGGSIGPLALSMDDNLVRFSFSLTTGSADERYIVRLQVKTDKGVGVENYETPYHDSFLLEADVPRVMSYQFANVLRPGRYWIQVVLAQIDEEGASVVAVLPNAFKFDIVGPQTGGIVNLAIHEAPVDDAAPGSSDNRTSLINRSDDALA